MRRRSGPRSGRKYPRKKHWQQQRDACYERAGANCEISGATLGYWKTPTHSHTIVWTWRRACDHIIPERFVRRWYPGADPHILENLVAVTPSIHARKTKVEWKLFKADWMGFREELQRIGYSLERINAARAAITQSYDEAKARNPAAANRRLPGPPPTQDV